MDTTNALLAVIATLLAALTLETVSGATNPLFRDLAGLLAIAVFLGVPVMALVRVLDPRG
ncbi:MAG: hypothetical protein ABEJ59_05345 [Halanaeroarchaeum sp.]